jgi:hypothetical protein
MAKHEGKDEKKHEEHPRKVHRGAKRARGGAAPETEAKFTESEMSDSEKPETERKRGGSVPHHHGRKSGGHVAGSAPKHRPDRRARGGATSDQNPLSSAGNMSRLPYESAPQTSRGGDEHGKGMDRD